jgi:hypothetical protein
MAIFQVHDPARRYLPRKWQVKHISQHVHLIRHSLCTLHLKACPKPAQVLHQQQHHKTNIESAGLKS